MTETSFPEFGTILAVWAHPDDESYLAAGTLTQAVDNGSVVTVTTATAGEAGTPDPIAWPPERLAAVRLAEAQAAMAALGVTDHRFLGFPDGGCANIPLDVAVQTIVRVIDDVVPDTILTFGPDGITGHADHRAVARWTTMAWDQRGRRERLLYAAHADHFLERFQQLHRTLEVFEDGFEPIRTPASRIAITTNLTGQTLDRKLVALRAQASQTAAPIDVMGLDTYAEWISTEWFIDAHEHPAFEGIIAS